MRGPGQQLEPQTPAGERAATRRGFAGARSALASFFASSQSGDEASASFGVRGWDAVPQLDIVGGRVFPNSGLAAVCPGAQEQSGPGCSRLRRPQSPRREPGHRFLPASAGVTSGFPSRRFALSLAAKESHLRRPLASAELNPHLELAPPRFPSQIPFPARLKWSERLSPSRGW